MDAQTEASAEQGDHAQAEGAAGAVADVVAVAGIGEGVVGLTQHRLGHADAPVGDGDHDLAAVEVPGGDGDGLGGRGEGGAVVEQLGQDVAEVVGDLGTQVDRRQRGQVDALVALDLGQGGAQHVQQGGGGTGAGGALLVAAGQQQHVLAVAAHPGGEVVELVELLQPQGVGLHLLQTLQAAELTLDQCERAQGEVGEDLAALAAAAAQGLGGVLEFLGEPDVVLLSLTVGAFQVVVGPTQPVHGGVPGDLFAPVGSAGAQLPQE